MTSVRIKNFRVRQYSYFWNPPKSIQFFPFPSKNGPISMFCSMQTSHLISIVFAFLNVSRNLLHDFMYSSLRMFMLMTYKKARISPGDSNCLVQGHGGIEPKIEFGYTLQLYISSFRWVVMCFSIFDAFCFLSIWGKAIRNYTLLSKYLSFV